jgi:hypothetical protein
MSWSHSCGMADLAQSLAQMAQAVELVEECQRRSETRIKLAM